MNSYRNSYFNTQTYKLEHNTLIASCRAGNVIGGGDWAEDRLMSDIMRAVSKSQTVDIRNPHATRPWQHVLEPLSAYLQLGQQLLEKRVEFSVAWNFGPNEEASLSVEDVVKSIKRYWPKIEYKISKQTNHFHEANLLKLDSTKANRLLSWKPIWSTLRSLEKTVQWYKAYYEKGIVLTENDLIDYIYDAKSQKAAWTLT